MANTTRHPALRIDVPTLEPDAVMIERLAAAGASSTPSPGTSWMIGLRAALVAVVVALLGATTWAAGALAGVDSPFRHREIQHAPLVPITPGTAGSPQSGGSASGGPASTGLPDASSTHHAQHRGAAHRRGKHAGDVHGRRVRTHGPGPFDRAPWNGPGRGHHYGWAHDRGRHHGKHHGKHHAYGRDHRRIG